MPGWLSGATIPGAAGPLAANRSLTEPMGGVMPSKMDGATSCAEAAGAAAARGRERTSSPGLGGLDLGSCAASPDSPASSERDDFADSARADADGVSRRKGVSPKGEPASPPLLRIQRRLLRSATST